MLVGLISGETSLPSLHVALHLLAVDFLESYFTSLSLGFLICKTGIIKNLPQRAIVRIK